MVLAGAVAVAIAPQNQAELPGKPEQQADGERHQQAGGQRLKQRDHDDARTRLFQRGALEKFPDAERDERQRQIAEKAHSLRHRGVDQIERPGTDQNARNNIGADVRKPANLRDPRQYKARRKHDRQRNQHRCDRMIAIVKFV